MINEFIFLIILILEFSFLLLSFRFGREALFATIVVNMLLISTFGAKLVSIFGFVSNTGNIFFASVFLATHILIEHYGRKEGYKTVWVGFLSLIFFILIGQFILRTSSASETMGVDAAMKTLFKTAPRIALASTVPFLLVQYVNVFIFSKLKEKTRGSQLWLRDTAANLVGQLIDSSLFFSIAFYGTLSTPVLFQTMIVGFLMKVLVGFAGTPLLYLTYKLKNQEIAP